MGIYVLAVLYVWVLIGFLIELISYIISKKFREHIDEAPILKTLLYAFLGLPIRLICIIGTASMMIKEHRSEKEQKRNHEGN